LGGGGAGQQLRGTAGSQYSQTGGQPGAGSGSFTQQDTLNRLKALDAGSSKYLNAGAQGGGQQSGSQIANQIANTQTKDLSREAAEWAGLQPMLGRLGYAFDNNTLNRLVNVYMDPGRGRNAGQNLKEAASFMIQDDIWAQAFQSETGYPPQQIHWDEHAMAMQGQGRDPLEGHPGAAQFMARKAAEIENQNQGAAIDIYRQLIPQGQGGLGTVY
jgi:hypothetical protein